MIITMMKTMAMMSKLLYALYALLVMILPFVEAQLPTLTVAANGGNKSSPLLYGTLYEVSN